ncbi:MAG: gliding motility lipoprotein GldH [Prolixibacteraceae bacterium]|nr:gliding motility lipoprotein GldH [Prolixibacteraceae bacterium]
MKQIRVFIVQFSLAIILFANIYSCGNKYFFEDFQYVPEAEWHKDSAIVFDFLVSETTANFDMYINIRNNTNYRFSNLWLFIEIFQPGGEAVEDTFEIILADPSGRWLGEGFAGLKTREAVYRRQFYFPVSGEYIVKVKHGMRQDILKGINDVGIRISKVKS